MRDLSRFQRRLRLVMGREVQHASAEHWSLTRSLAFLAAAFAIVLSALMPPAVAQAGSPLAMCSGERMLVVYDADGRPVPKEPMGDMGPGCAMCVLSHQAALPPPPPPCQTAPPLRPSAVRWSPSGVLARVPPLRAAPRPPSTAPPIA